MDPTEAAPPEQLLVLARAGSPAAAGELLEHYRPYLTVLARVQLGRRLQGKADAADLVQETFLEAHRDFGGFRGTTAGELRAWLRQVLARDVRLERSLSQELDESSRMLDAGLAAAQSTPSQQADRREQAVRLADALDRLPEAYRDVLILRYLEGLKFPEVARRMGRSLDS